MGAVWLDRVANGILRNLPLTSSLCVTRSWNFFIWPLDCEIRVVHGRALKADNVCIALWGRAHRSEAVRSGKRLQVP